jgi:hypothetical protein
LPPRRLPALQSSEISPLAPMRRLRPEFSGGILEWRVK